MPLQRKVALFTWLGGGNPAQIPEVEAYFRACMAEILQTSKQVLKDWLEIMQDHKVSTNSRKHLRNCCKEPMAGILDQKILPSPMEARWHLLFCFVYCPANTLIIRPDKFLLPMAPEYIGYNEADEKAPRFRSLRPKIVETSSVTFKYEIDFSQIEVNDEIGAICISRPNQSNRKYDLR